MSAAADAADNPPRPTCFLNYIFSVSSTWWRKQQGRGWRGGGAGGGGGAPLCIMKAAAPERSEWSERRHTPLPLFVLNLKLFAYFIVHTKLRFTFSILYHLAIKPRTNYTNTYITSCTWHITALLLMQQKGENLCFIAYKQQVNMTCMCYRPHWYKFVSSSKKPRLELRVEWTIWSVDVAVVGRELHGWKLPRGQSSASGCGTPVTAVHIAIIDIILNRTMLFYTFSEFKWKWKFLLPLFCV